MSRDTELIILYIWAMPHTLTLIIYFMAVFIPNLYIFVDKYHRNIGIYNIAWLFVWQVGAGIYMITTSIIGEI